MVLYRVFSEPHLVKHYSAIFSRATLFQVLFYAIVIIVPFFVAYATNGKRQRAHILFNAHHTCTAFLKICGSILVHTESSRMYIFSTSGLCKSPALTTLLADHGVLFRDTIASLGQQKQLYLSSKYIATDNQHDYLYDFLTVFYARSSMKMISTLTDSMTD